jgi:hypothetical protein
VEGENRSTGILSHVVAKRASGHGGRPKSRKWAGYEICGFQLRVQKLLEGLRYSPEELDFALDYSPQGRMTRQILLGRQPSAPYVEKFEAIEADPPEAKPKWLPSALAVLTGETVPMSMVESEPRACLECLARRAEGADVDEFFFPRHPSQVVHRQCRRAWRRRRDWFRRCEGLDCPHLVRIDGTRAMSCGHGVVVDWQGPTRFSGEGCALRRKPWLQGTGEK